MTKKRVAVVLSGCGFLDGAEITEAVSALIALSEANADYKIFAPETELDTVNHTTGKPTGEKRNVLTEAARIARGKALAIEKLKTKDFDAVVFPGGYGAAKNLSTWATEGSKCRLNKEISDIITDFHKAGKPICAICISPALVAKALGKQHVSVTIGNDRETALEIEKTGARHVECEVDDYVTDREAKVITTPAYMYNAKPHEVFAGVRAAIKEMMAMA